MSIKKSKPKANSKKIAKHEIKQGTAHLHSLWLNKLNTSIKKHQKKNTDFSISDDDLKRLLAIAVLKWDDFTEDTPNSRLKNAETLHAQGHPVTIADLYFFTFLKYRDFACKLIPKVREWHEKIDPLDRMLMFEDVENLSDCDIYNILRDRGYTYSIDAITVRRCRLSQNIQASKRE